MAAANGLILVPAGSSLVAYGSYAPGSPSGTGSGTASGTAPAPTHSLSATVQLRGEIVLRRLTVRRFLARGSVRLRVSAPAAGHVTVRWFYAPPHARQRRLVAAGTLRFARAGRRLLTLRRRRSARRVLRGTRHGAAILAEAQFVPAHGRRVGVSARFRLRG